MLNGVDSFLSLLPQHVVVNGVRSDKSPVSRVVLQCIILDPLLFSWYMKDILYNDASNNLSIT